MGEKLDLSMGDALWLVRDEHGLIRETWRLPAAWLTHLPPRADYPAGLLRVVPDKGFCADAPRPGMIVMADARMPTSLAAGFYLNKRDCLVNDGASSPPRIAVLDLKPGDTIVATLGADMVATEDEIKGLRGRLQEPFPGHKILILSGIELSVLRPTPAADQPAPATPPEPPKRGREFI